ncbi:hypothetical protein PR048_006892 [Dryococelus australis]|uniref:Uncharacterized protein n=1 Tax=Dryococelus australis TaxID=614101 RepID=A0ABQ9IDG0_9NEOP|nr:hypothetical protein PR048_006892 [Dryococelus australis]
MKVALLACVPLMLSMASGHEIRRLLDDVAVDRLRGNDVEAHPDFLKDVAVDVDDERFLQITHLRVSNARLEGDFQMVSNAVTQDFRGGGHFSAPDAVVSLFKNLGSALVSAVRFFSGSRLSPGATQRLDGYLKRNGVDPLDVEASLAGNRSDSELLASQMYERLMSEDLDEIVDFLLDVVRRKIREAGKDELEIPDQDCLRKRRHHRSRKVFYAAGGTVKGVSRLTRAGPTTVRREGSVIVVTCPLRLDRLDVLYEAYGLQLSRLKVASGGVKGGVRASPVEVSVDVGLADDGCCSAAVRRLQLSAGEVRLRLSGLSASHPTVDSCQRLLRRPLPPHCRSARRASALGRRHEHPARVPLPALILQPFTRISVTLPTTARPSWALVVILHGASTRQLLMCGSSFTSM